MERASPDDLNDGTSTSQPAQREIPQSEEALEAESPGATPPPAADDAESGQKPAQPMHKRRRVTRACDECRRKKIKCDGKQPCTHCTVYSYECTYDQPSNRRRNAAPQYIEALETRIKRAETLLHIVLPNVDLNDPSLEAGLQQGAFRPLASIRTGTGYGNLRDTTKEKVSTTPEGMDAHLESMVRATGQLDLDDEGHWDYHGHSSGLSFVRRMREQFGDILGPEAPATPFVKSRPMSQVFESPRSNADSPFDFHSSTTDLPPRQVARQLCENAINDAAALLRVVHMPTFIRSFEKLYDTNPENYGNEEHTFLPLFYSVLALGSLFAQDDALDIKGYENAIDEGFKHFKAARQLMDIADCRDLVSLQAVIFMILFLQSSAKLPTCYSYIGVALRSALRMGLHRSFSDSFDPVEAETRKRIFWAIRKMDTYVGALLGLPHTVSDDDIDQDFPIETGDDHITTKEIRPMPAGSVTIMTAFNAHTNLVRILAKIVRYIYPLKSANPSGQKSSMHTYSVSYAKIREIEKDLQEWMEKLPMGLKPGGEAPPIMIRIQQLLRLAYAHCQMMLYRPFLHYVSQTSKPRNINKRAYACAAACVSVSRNIVHITAEMKRRGLLIGAHWFTMYTTFFAILSLVYFALENPDNVASQDVLQDANEGKEVLAQLAKRSMAADRCTATLATLFNQLPERLKTARQHPIAAKKRRQESPPHSLSQTTNTLSNPTLKHVEAASLPDQLSNKRSSYPQPLALSQPPLPMDSAYKHSSAANFFDAAPSLTPTSASASTFAYSTPHQQQLPYPLSPSNSTSSNPPLPDLSSMMFPSSDPFAYPKQPMTTFENNGFVNSNGMDNSPFFPFPPTTVSSEDLSNPSNAPFATNVNGPFFTPPSSTMTPADTTGGDLDVQLFGPMPMYLMPGATGPQAQQQGFGMQGPQQPLHQQQQGPMDAAGNPSGAGMNLDELFGGEEWAGVFDQQGGMSGFGTGLGAGFR